jgi:Holliday junction resolvasome RuvABC endonuclease subunit
MSIVLGLDISTSHVGVCVYDNKENKILKIDNILLSKLVKDGDIFKKTAIFKEEIEKVFEEFQINKTIIEKPLDAFSMGRSSAGTIIKLHNFNILCQYILNEMNVKFESFARTTILKKVTGRGRKPKKYTNIDTKEWLAVYFIAEQPGIELKYYSRGKNEGKLHAESYDMIDAWACCKFVKP